MYKFDTDKIDKSKNVYKNIVILLLSFRPLGSLDVEKEINTLVLLRFFFFLSFQFSRNGKFVLFLS